MTTTTRWWWIRHAPVTTDGGNIYGQIDIDADVADAAPFAGLAATLPRDAVWLASSLRRTHQTARAIAEAGLPIPDPLVEPDFAEQHFGALQGRNRAETVRSQAGWPGFWIAGVDHTPEGGESFIALMERVRSAIKRWTDVHGGRDIVAVGHGGTIRAAIGVALGLDPARAVAFKIDNLGVTRLDHLAGPKGEEAWRIAAINVPPGGTIAA